MRNNELEAVLHEEIPLTRAMGLTVSEVSEGAISLQAPLQPNINHKSTAFGGSLYSVCVLTGWGMIYSRLSELKLHAHIVIQESHIQYIKPVASDIAASCRIDNPEQFQRFIKLFKRKGKSRIQLKVTVHQDDQLAVEFTGNYVIHQ